MNSKYLHCSFYVDLKPFLFWNRNLELKAAQVWKVRWMALVQISCCPLFRSYATSRVRNTEDVVAPGVLLGRGVQLWQSSAQKGKTWVVCVHLETCAAAFLYMRA